MENRVFVRNIVFKANNNDLQNYFNNCGEIVDARVITDKATGRSRGFGYVTFNSKEAVHKALDMNGMSFDGREIEVMVAEPRPLKK